MDGERAAAVLRELDGALDRLEQYARDIDLVLFTTQGVHQDGVLRAMTLAGQCAIDLALMIIADRRLGSPPTYREAFLALARARIIPRESEQPLAQWASIRNVIVHLYTKLDLEELHRAYTARTGVLRKFRTTAASLLAASAPPSGAPGKSGPSSVAEAPVPYRRARPLRPRPRPRTRNQ
ncbi:MAG: DUF86 domain-containing protein [Deltaproteobacteria bacterium]|nr:DUF86 domain-containing protein [Deltaproteobacteria bacterium]